MFVQQIFIKGLARDFVAKAGWEGKYGENIEYRSLQQALRRIRTNDTGSNS